MPNDLPAGLALMEVFSDRDPTPKYIIVQSDGRLLSFAEAVAIIQAATDRDGQRRLPPPPIITT
jgi:hypothetical protein